MELFRDIERNYHVGYSYAKNILDNLEEIECIKKRTNMDYSMIQTEQAKEEAEQLGVKLWDRDKLNEMIEKHD